MTRKDYVLLARALGLASEKLDSGDGSQWLGFSKAMRAVVDALKSDNARFDENLFYEEVGKAVFRVPASA